MGFGNVNILYDEKDNSNHSTFSFSGPDISINNLDFNISFLAENQWKELKQEYFPQADVFEAKEMMAEINRHCELYAYYHDKYPNSLYVLEISEYFSIPSSLKQSWKFEILDRDIKATSLAGFSDGPGKIIIFHSNTHEYTGYKTNNHYDRSN